MKYGSILTIDQKSLNKIWLWFLREIFRIKVLLFDVTLYIESLQLIWNEIQYEPFHILPFQPIDQSIFLYFKSSLWKLGILLLKIIK
jgi:hypothetical protein